MGPTRHRRVVVAVALSAIPVHLPSSVLLPPAAWSVRRNPAAHCLVVMTHLPVGEAIVSWVVLNWVVLSSVVLHFVKF